MNKGDKIELVSCPRNGKNCDKHLDMINTHFNESIIYQSEKNYRRSVELLKRAFDETMNLKEPTCVRCAALYRSTIIESLESTYDDLRAMTSGLFRSDRYKGSYIMADSVLQDLKSRSAILEKNGQNIAF
jgi:hypothetical protein